MQKVSLDGSRSVDNDGRCQTFRWLLKGKPVSSGMNPSIDLPVGNHSIILAVKDDDGADGFAAVEITVLPQTDPVPSPEGLVMWLKADSLTSLADGSPVTKWSDSSGNGMDTEQPAAGRQPVYVAKGGAVCQLFVSTEWTIILSSMSAPGCCSRFTSRQSSPSFARNQAAQSSARHTPI
jgi:hypothetical protein